MDKIEFIFEEGKAEPIGIEGPWGTSDYWVFIEEAEFQYYLQNSGGNTELIDEDIIDELPDDDIEQG